MDQATLLSWGSIVLSGAVTVILIPLAIHFARYYWDRRRWSAFERRTRAWAKAEQLLPEHLEDEEWRSVVAIRLSDAGFEPEKIRDLVELAVWFAKGIAIQEVQGKA